MSSLEHTRRWQHHRQPRRIHVDFTTPDFERPESEERDANTTTDQGEAR